MAAWLQAGPAHYTAGLDTSEEARCIGMSWKAQTLRLSFPIAHASHPEEPEIHSFALVKRILASYHNGGPQLVQPQGRTSYIPLWHKILDRKLYFPFRAPLYKRIQHAVYACANVSEPDTLLSYLDVRPGERATAEEHVEKLIAERDAARAQQVLPVDDVRTQIQALQSANDKVDVAHALRDLLFTIIQSDHIDPDTAVAVGNVVQPHRSHDSARKILRSLDDSANPGRDSGLENAQPGKKSPGSGSSVSHSPARHLSHKKKNTRENGGLSSEGPRECQYSCGVSQTS